MTRFRRILRVLLHPAATVGHMDVLHDMIDQLSEALQAEFDHRHRSLDPGV